MDVGMGGRAAEDVIYGQEKVTTGASSDLQMATRVATAMVMHSGMSEKVIQWNLAITRTTGPSKSPRYSRGLVIAEVLIFTGK